MVSFPKNKRKYPCCSWASLVAQTVKNLLAMQETRVWYLGQEEPWEKGKSIHSNILAWRIPWTEECGRLPSIGSERVGHDWPTNTFIFGFPGGTVVKNQLANAWDAEAPILWSPDVKNWLLGKDPDAGKDWRWEEKRMAEDEIVGWHHQLSGREFE